MTWKFPPRFTCGFGGNHSSQASFWLSSSPNAYEQNSSSYFFHTSSIAISVQERDPVGWWNCIFFSSTGCQCYTTAVVRFQVLGKVGLLCGEDFWKVFLLWWASDVKDHWSSGEWAQGSVDVFPLAAAEAGWDPACKRLKVSNLTGTVAWETDTSVLWSTPQLFDYSNLTSLCHENTWPLLF